LTGQGKKDSVTARGRVNLPDIVEKEVFFPDEKMDQDRRNRTGSRLRPFAPGTVGTIVGIPLYLPFRPYPGRFIFLPFCFTVWPSDFPKAEVLFQEKDSPRIVIDEISSPVHPGAGRADPSACDQRVSALVDFSISSKSSRSNRSDRLPVVTALWRMMCCGDLRRCPAPAVDGVMGMTAQENI
jgi:hypothetical protein